MVIPNSRCNIGYYLFEGPKVESSEDRENVGETWAQEVVEEQGNFLLRLWSWSRMLEIQGVPLLRLEKLIRPLPSQQEEAMKAMLSEYLLWSCHVSSDTLEYCSTKRGSLTKRRTAQTKCKSSATVSLKIELGPIVARALMMLMKLLMLSRRVR